MPSKTKRPKVPKFKTEAEEAEWWDARMDMVGGELLKAMNHGTEGRGTAQRLVKEARLSHNITIRMPISDIERAQKLAEKKGIGHQRVAGVRRKIARLRNSAIIGPCSMIFFG